MTMGQVTVKVPVWNIESLCGYKPMTTFWQDFSIADAFGIAAVVDTFKRAFKEWKDNYKYLSELVMVLNHKIWQWYQKNTSLAKVYNKVWELADGYAVNNLKDEKLEYFYRVTD